MDTITHTMAKRWASVGYGYGLIFYSLEKIELDGPHVLINGRSSRYQLAG